MKEKEFITLMLLKSNGEPGSTTHARMWQIPEEVAEQLAEGLTNILGTPFEGVADVPDPETREEGMRMLNATILSYGGEPAPE